MRLIPVLLALSCFVAGCRSGPGAECDPCAEAEVAPGATAPFGNAAAAAASGGQRASNQPQQMDPARINPNTVVGRGAGPTTFTKSDSESRSLAGAPSVNQGLVIPNSAEASAGGGVSPVVASLQAQLEMLRGQLQLALMSPTTDQARLDFLSKQVNETISAMAQAQAAMVQHVTNTYNFQEARIVQSTANGSNSGDGTTAIDPKAADAVAKPLAGAVKETMNPAPAAPDAPEPAPVPAPTPTPSNP